MLTIFDELKNRPMFDNIDNRKSRKYLMWQAER